MHRYWFKFILNNNTPIYMRLGCGLTAYNYEDAISILKQKVFYNIPFPQIDNFIENVDISTLDEKHVLVNMGLPNIRGIWFPAGYQ